MIAASKPTRPNSNSPRSGEREALADRQCEQKVRCLRGDTLIVLEHAAQSLVADNPLVIAERLINVGPLTNQRSVADAVTLMRPNAVVMAEILGNEKIDVLLAEDQEEVEALELDRLDPTLDEGVLVRRLRRGGNNSTADVVEDLIESLDVHAIVVADQVIDLQVRFAGLLDERMSLRSHPFSIGLETTGRADGSPRADVQESQDKRLPQSGRRPYHLAEEVDLPERIDVSFEKLIPSPAAAPWARLDAFVREDVPDRRLRNAADAEFAEFPQGRRGQPWFSVFDMVGCRAVDDFVLTTAVRNALKTKNSVSRGHLPHRDARRWATRTVS